MALSEMILSGEIHFIEQIIWLRTLLEWEKEWVQEKPQQIVWIEEFHNH